MIRVEADAGHLVVRNPAGALAHADVPCLFDRFWRKDTARTGYGHAGLGLSLMRGFCALLDWRITAALLAGAPTGPSADTGPEADAGHLVVRNPAGALAPGDVPRTGRPNQSRWK